MPACLSTGERGKRAMVLAPEDSPHNAEPVSLPGTDSAAAQGLSEREAGARRAAGQGNTAPLRTGRTYSQIIRENVFSFINNILFLLGLALMVVGRPLDALVSVGVIAVNIV